MIGGRISCCQSKAEKDKSTGRRAERPRSSSRRVKDTDPTPDPYPADDWAGSSKRRMFVDMICTNSTEPGAKPSITLGRLQESIPEFEWQKGHSGVLLPEGVAAKLDEEGGKE
jgi:hypothetical protein